MADFEKAMMGISGVGGVLQGLGGLGLAIANANAIGAQAAFQKQQYEFNAKVADFQARDAIRRGDRAAHAVRRQGRQLKGAQRVAAAAQGIDPDSGTAADLQTQTEYFAELDATTIRGNAFREALGYKLQALDLTGRGTLAQMAASTQAKMTLATGGLQALGYLTQAGRDFAKMG
jgi:hypothetical protein